MIVVFRGALTGISHAKSNATLTATSDSRVCSSISKQLRYITTKTVTDLVCCFMTEREVPLEQRSESTTSCKLSEIALLIGSIQQRPCNDRHVGEAAQ